MKWEKVVTRNYFLLEVFFNQNAYGMIPLFPLKSVLAVNKNGVVTRYVDKKQLEEFFCFLRENVDKLKPIFDKAMIVENELREIITGDPLDVFSLFHKKYLEAWSYCLLGHFCGFALDEEQIKPIKEQAEFIRGPESVMNEIKTQFFHRLLDALHNKTGIDRTLVGYIFPEELINEEFNVNDMKKRKKHYVWKIINEDSNFYVGEEADNIETKELGDIGNEFGISEVKGVSTFNGFVKGKAKVVLSLDDIEKIENGDIIVTPMLNPHHHVLLDKISAIVTDEGGITCHAAIISREMKIPCVIGTKSATLSFKDGDLIEVDADNGRVRKV